MRTTSRLTIATRREPVKVEFQLSFAIIPRTLRYLQSSIAGLSRANLLRIGASSLLAVSCQAAILNYSITYTGAGTFPPPAETVLGSGMFQITTIGLTGTITGFSFTDAITTTASSNYSYALANLLSTNSVTLGGTVANPTLATVTLSTGYVAGTNAAFGKANFTANYSGANPGTGSTSTNPTVLAGITNGSVTITPTVPVATPEPTTLALIGLGLAGVGCNYIRGRATVRP